MNNNYICELLRGDRCPEMLVDAWLCDDTSDDAMVLSKKKSKTFQIFDPQIPTLENVSETCCAWPSSQVLESCQTAASSGKNKPLVSVIIPAYNASRFIERTLTSVLHQTYQMIEVLVVDDGSTDDTVSIIQTLASIDQRIRLLQQPNAGVAAARNHAISKAKGEFVAPIDADDIWHPTNLEKQAQVLMATDEMTAMVYSWSVDIDEADCLTGGTRVSPYYGNIYPAMLYQNIVGHASSCMIRRSCLDAVGGYSTELLAQKAQGCEDWDLYLRIARNYQIALVPELLVGYRQVRGSMSRQTDAMARSRTLTLQPIKERFPKVYSCVSNWYASAIHMHAARQCFNTDDSVTAWATFWKAFHTDRLFTLTTYSNWPFFLKLLRQYLLSSDEGNVSARNGSDTLVSQSSPGELSDTKISFIVKMKIYSRMLLTALFPARLMHLLRVRWIHSKVCPEKDGPSNVPLMVLYKCQLEVHMQSKPPNCYVEFGQHTSPRELAR